MIKQIPIKQVSNYSENCYIGYIGNKEMMQLDTPSDFLDMEVRKQIIW